MDSITPVIYYVSFNLTKAVLAPLQRDSFIYWPYLLSTLVLSVAVWFFAKRGPWREFTGRFFSRALWWHRSARADYRLYFFNALTLPFLFALILPAYQPLAEALVRRFGLPHWPAASVDAVGWRVAFTLLFFVAYDFGRYLAHYLLHRVPLCWQFHQVHHSAEVLTPLTAFRAHPVDLLIMAWGSLIFTTPLYLLFNALAGGKVDVYQWMGLHVLFALTNLIGNLHHSRIWLSYGPTWGKWLISPAHHQIHHGAEPRHWDKNIGFELAIWDRLFGTLLVPTVAEEAFPLGINTAQDPRWQTLRHMLFAPFVGAARIVFGWPRGKNRVGGEA